MPSKLLSVFTMLFVLTISACGLIPNQASSAINAINVDQNRIAIKGYDAVAYFTESTAVKGDSRYSAEYDGAVYYFASAQHQDLFEQAPSKYAPQYGGYCAFGVTQEKKYDIDPTAWAVVDGKLYLNLNAGAQRVWDKDRAGNIESGDAIWFDIAEKPVSQ